MLASTLYKLASAGERWRRSYRARYEKDRPDALELQRSIRAWPPKTGRRQPSNHCNKAPDKRPAMERLDPTNIRWVELQEYPELPGDLRDAVAGRLLLFKVRTITMPNRSLAVKAKRAAVQRMTFALAMDHCELVKPYMTAHKAAKPELVALAAACTIKPKRLKTGVASGLAEDVGTMGKGKRTRTEYKGEDFSKRIVLGYR